MSAAPRLLAGRRRGLAIGLAAFALWEAALAVLFAAAIDQLMTHQGAPAMPLAAAAGIALVAALVLLIARWIGEDFAQHFVTDCRAALFEAVTRSRGAGKDAGWLTCLINDMAALRNYALRGTVRLWTSMLSASAAGVWVLIAMPALRPALIPLVVGAAAMIALASPLRRAITAQRSQRGRLNRFLVRRVRAELADEPAPKGHGFRKLERLSGDLARRSIARAAGAGMIDAVATAAGLAAALVLVSQASRGADQAGLAGSLTLFGFITARQLETGRALHALIAGRIALLRLDARLQAVPAPLTGPPTRRPRSGRSRRGVHARRLLPTPVRKLPSPQQDPSPQEPN